MASEIDKNLLIIVLDINPLQKLIRKVLTQCLDSTIVFANAYLMQGPNNELAIMACHGQGARFLYPCPIMPEIQQFDGQYERFTQIERTVRQQIHKIYDELQLENMSKPESLISGAFAIALCYVSRMEREKHAREKLNARILLLTASHDAATQYMNYMNIFFTAQKMGIIIDVCSIQQELTLLQQGCDLTGGNYLKIPEHNGEPHLSGLLQYLLWIFLPDPSIRSKLVLPPPVKVDYRAACFCHQQLVDVAYVCSVCLSIFCKVSPICTTCHTVFKMPAPIPLKMKKKKKIAELST